MVNRPFASNWKDALPGWKTLQLCLCLAVSAPAFAANLGIIHGTVHEYNLKPLPQTRVDLLARGDRLVDQHLTDQDGHFEFEQIPFGQYRILFYAPDGRIEERAVRVASGDVTTVDVTMPFLGEEIVITAPTPEAPPPPTTASSSSTLDREEIKSLPRGDTASVNEILATQPGFVYDALGNLFVRGNHANVQYQIDGVPLPDSVSGLFGGFLSPKFIENMELVTGGLSAEYGERLSAVVNLNSRRPPPSGEGEVEVLYGEFQTVSPSFQYGRKLGRLSLLGGGSFRRTDRALDPPALQPILHDTGDEERAFLRADYDFNDRDHVSAFASFARNRYQIPIDPTARPFDPSLPNGGRIPDAYGNSPPPFFPRDTDSTETERDFFSLVSYRHDFGPQSSIRASGYYRHSLASFYGDPAHALGPLADPCMTDDTGAQSCSQTSDVRRQADHFGVDAEYLIRFGEVHIIKVGGKLDQLYGTTDYTSYTRNDTLRGLDPSLTLSGSDTAHATSGGIFAQDRLSLGNWVVNAGLRFDFQTVSFSGNPQLTSETGLGPRVGVSYSFTKNVVAHVYYGLLWTPPPVLDTPAAARQLGVVPPDQPIPYDLRAEKANYAEAGISARVVPQLTLNLNAWGRLSTDQLDDVEVGNTSVLSPYNFRDGRAAGVEGSAVLVVGRWLNAFGNVSLEKAQGRGLASAKYLFSPDALANNSWQTLDHSQTWTSTTGATIYDGPTQVSALMTYGSGLRTGPQNNQHVSDHVRVDLTVGHKFLAVPGYPTLSLDIVNLFDAHYPYRIANGFNGSHWAAGRAAYVRLSTSF